MYSLNYSHDFRKILKKIPQEDQLRIIRQAEKLRNWPVNLDLIKIAGASLRPIYRLRIGNYRLFFSVDTLTQQIDVHDVKRRTSTTYRQ